MNTQIMPVSGDCRHLGFDRKGLNPVRFVSLFAHFYELDKEEKNSFYVQCWRKLYSEHLHMTSLEVKGQVLSPAFDRGNTRAQECRGIYLPSDSSLDARPRSRLPSWMSSAWRAQPPSLSSARQSLLPGPGNWDQDSTVSRSLSWSRERSSVFLATWMEKYRKSISM